MKSCSELRGMSREQLKGNWGTPILVSLVYTIIIVGLQFIPFVGFIAILILAAPLTLGLINYFVSLTRDEDPKFDSLFLGFDNFGKSLGVYFLQALFVFLWGLFALIPIGIFVFNAFTNPYIFTESLSSFLFIYLCLIIFYIPAMIAQYRYSMSFYILRDNPEIGIHQSIRESSEMMKGYKWKFFLLGLSFIGWGLLCVLTLGIGLLWLMPYMNTTYANFYNELKKSREPEVVSQLEEKEF